MNTYPYIGEGKNSGSIALIYDEAKCITLKSKTWASEDFELCEGINERFFKNITTEYLANTYGEVKSKEHAEFIVKLCKNAGIDVFPQLFCANHFIIKGKLSFHNCERITSSELKLITIPLPPESNPNTPEEDFEMQQIEKNNGDNLIFSGDNKCKEWPCVNDEVLTSDGNGVVKLLADSKGYYVVSVDGEYYQYLIDELSKPKTPEEEELIDKIESVFRTFSANDYLRGRQRELAIKFIDDFNIKPQ